MKGAFLFLAPGAKREEGCVEVGELQLVTVAVADYSEAVAVAKDLVSQGVMAIELCGGFGNRGLAMLTEAVEGKALVGAVRFDVHPGMNHQSGDQLFL